MEERERQVARRVDPVVEVYKKDVDRSLLRRNLEKTPEQRILDLQELLKLAEEARRAGREARTRN
jgi:hypothetical protein